jgi:lipopolysaccharide export system permease protein
VFLSILHRYVLAELLRVFILALAAITGILVLVLLVAEASQQGLPATAIAKLIPLVVPSTLPFTIPTTTLFAVAVVYGRLSHDNEITAVKSAGVPITKLLWPAFYLGVAMSVVVFFLYEEVIPRATHAFKRAALEDIQELLYAKLRRDLRFQQAGVNYSIFVKEVQGRRLLGAIFKKRDDKTGDEIVVSAREAELEVNLERGEVVVTMRYGELTRSDGSRVIIDDEMNFAVPLPPTFYARQPRARELTNSQLLASIRAQQKEQQRLVEAIHAKFGHFQHNEELIKKNEENRKLYYSFRKQWELETEYAMRPALAASCLCFVLIGCPVAVWFHRRDYLSAFVACFLPITITYYPLVMFGINLGKEGRIEPSLLLWAGDALLGATGLGLLRRLLRH